MNTNILIIDGTKKAPCAFCGRVEELRPYGPKGENICFECAMKDEKAAAEQFHKLTRGKQIIVIK